MERTRGTIRCGLVPYAVPVLLLLMMGSCVQGLTVTVEKEECVFDYVFYDSDTVSGNFVVVDHELYWNSDHSGIDFTVTSPGGSIVHTLKGTSGDKFEFKAPSSGMYKFCFHNPYSVPESVSFSIHTGHIPNEHDLAKDEHLDPINVRIAELREKLEYVTLEQKYLKARDLSHRRTNQSTRKRVIFYTVGEYLLLVVASGLQVVYVRRLFSKSVAYNRV
ncbi:transmembrane emp24 domain-containing protein p24 beta 3 [Striga asiatica]|uniref:Transmembrane emp24 domain-containing protein p24 beta 3 n=1 Tax=Striga asiatica TaxID=4170 RepID=A0A5A7RE67_STRAF|nr:transmembrane emp24 domain-containing protein p24 beta 3 [Striga asiatica]